MKDKVLDYIESSIPYVITPAKYLMYIGVGFFAWQLVGTVTYYALSKIGFIATGGLAIIDYAVNLFSAITLAIGSFPIIANVPLIGSIIKIPSIVLNPIVSFIASIPKLVLSIPSPVVATIISAAIVAKKMLGTSEKEPKEQKQNEPQEQKQNGLSNFIAKKLEPYKKFTILGHAVEKIEQYSNSKSFEDFIKKRINTYRTSSLTPVIVSSTIAATVFSGAFMLGAPILLGGIASLAGYSVARSNLKEFSKELDDKGFYERIAKIAPLASKGISIGSFIATPVTFFKNNALGHIVNAFKINSPFNILSRPYLTGIFPAISIAKSLWVPDGDRGASHRVFNSQFQNFLTLNASSITLALFAPVLPIIAPVLATTMHLGLVTGAFSAASLVSMYVNDPSNLDRAFDDTKKFVTKDKLPFFNRPIGHVFLETWNMLGGLFAGSYIGFKLPFIQAKDVSSFVGGLIGAFVNKKLVDNYFPEIPEATPPIATDMQSKQTGEQPERSTNWVNGTTFYSGRNR